MSPDRPEPAIPVALLSSGDTDGEVSRVLAKLEATKNARKLYRVLANSPVLFRPFVLLTGGLVTNEELPPDVREVVVRHLAGRADVAYEWAEHVPISRSAGVSDEQRDVIGAGGDLAAPLFSDEHRLAVRIADQIVHRPPIDPADWERAIEAWSVAGAMHLLLAVACWGALVPTIIEAVGLREP